MVEDLDRLLDICNYLHVSSQDLASTTKDFISTYREMALDTKRGEGINFLTPAEEQTLKNYAMCEVLEYYTLILTDYYRYK